MGHQLLFIRRLYFHCFGIRARAMRPAMQVAMITNAVATVRTNFHFTQRTRVQTVERFESRAQPLFTDEIFLRNAKITKSPR